MGVAFFRNRRRRVVAEQVVQPESASARTGHDLGATYLTPPAAERPKPARRSKATPTSKP